MRVSALFALLSQVGYLALSEAATTSITTDIQEACSDEINSCTSGSLDCLTCLAQFVDLDTSVFDAPEGSDCKSGYISVCSVMLDDYGCNGDDPYTNAVAGCVASELFEGCDDFVSCAISASTNAPTFSPTSQPIEVTASPSVGQPSAATQSPTLLETTFTASPSMSGTASPTLGPLQESSTAAPTGSTDTQNDASGSRGCIQRDSWVAIVSTLGVVYAAGITVLS